MKTRRIRSFVAAVLLALLTGACELSVDVGTQMADDGSGTFRVVFAFDKEFIEVVRSTEQGAATLDQLSETGAQFGGSGWVVKQTQPDGGLRIDISRDFDDPDELENALRAVEQESGGRALSFPSVFRNFRIDHSSSFFSVSSDVTGTVDLTPERLVPGAEAGEELRAALRQAARDVFRFRVSLDLPGRVAEYQGDPESLSGGSIVWVVPFGETLEFAAASEGTKTSALLIVFGPVTVVLLIVIVWLLRRRRRERTAVVPGWDVASATPEPEPASSVSEDVTTNGGSE